MKLSRLGRGLLWVWDTVWADVHRAMAGRRAGQSLERQAQANRHSGKARDHDDRAAGLLDPRDPTETGV